MIKLWNKTPYYNEEWGMDPVITPYIVPNTEKPRGAVIVLPGGGYEMLADHEGEPYAMMLNKAGIHAFVLRYRLSPYQHPAMLADVQRAVRFVRYYAYRFHIDPDKIAVMGSSAGAHAAMMAALHYDEALSFEQDEIDQTDARPNAALFCYGVVTMGKYTHEGSRNALLGDHPTEDMIAYASGECSVPDDCPPIFMWHTANDETVPVENSLQLATALRKKEIPFELHVFPEGHHGLGLATDAPHVAQWADLAKNWLLLQKF